MSYEADLAELTAEEYAADLAAERMHADPDEPVDDGTDPLDDEYEDDAAYDFAAEPEPLPDLDAIDRAGYRLAKATAALADFDGIAAQRIADMQAVYERQRGPLVEKVGYLTRQLELAHQSIIAADPTRTRIVLPNVTLASKAGTVKWIYPDPATDPDTYARMMGWLAAHDAVRVPKIPDPEPDKNAVKALAKAKTLTKQYGDTVPATEDGSVVTDDGEIIPGVRVIATPRTYKPEVMG